MLKFAVVSNSDKTDWNLQNPEQENVLNFETMESHIVVLYETTIQHESLLKQNVFTIFWTGT